MFWLLLFLASCARALYPVSVGFFPDVSVDAMDVGRACGCFNATQAWCARYPAEPHTRNTRFVSFTQYLSAHHVLPTQPALQRCLHARAGLDQKHKLLWMTTSTPRKLAIVWVFFLQLFALAFHFYILSKLRGK